MPDQRADKTVLAVARDASVLVLLRAVFENNGYRVLLARSAEEASELLGRLEIPIAVLLSDVEFMGDSSGSLEQAVGAFRPGIRAAYISATTECGAIRIRIMSRLGPGYYTQDSNTNLLDAVQNAVSSTTLRAGA
jgi:DNA-binding NtrC family response regulator